MLAVNQPLQESFSPFIIKLEMEASVKEMLFWCCGVYFATFWTATTSAKVLATATRNIAVFANQRTPPPATNKIIISNQILYVP